MDMHTCHKRQLNENGRPLLTCAQMCDLPFVRYLEASVDLSTARRGCSDTVVKMAPKNRSQYGDVDMPEGALVFLRAFRQSADAYIGHRCHSFDGVPFKREARRSCRGSYDQSQTSDQP
jgi:hypothetical protein